MVHRFHNYRIPTISSLSLHLYGDAAIQPFPDFRKLAFISPRYTIGKSNLWSIFIEKLCQNLHYRSANKQCHGSACMPSAKLIILSSNTDKERYTSPKIHMAWRIYKFDFLHPPTEKDVLLSG